MIDFWKLYRLVYSIMILILKLIAFDIRYVFILLLCIRL